MRKCPRVQCAQMASAHVRIGMEKTCVIRRTGPCPVVTVLASVSSVFGPGRHRYPQNCYCANGYTLICLEITGLKSVISVKLRREFGMRQATAWHLQRRIRTALLQEVATEFLGVVEVDETYIDITCWMRARNESLIPKVGHK